jgi:hypothetical protein
MIEFWSATTRIGAGMGKCLLLLSLGSLGACASFQARPEPVLSTMAVVNSANIDIRAALIAFAAPSDDAREGLDPKGYRNMVIGTHLMAADVRYSQFRGRLAAEARGSSLLLDIGILGLSGGASLATEATANALAAGAAGLTGTRAAVSRDVYFDRTVPAMIGVMDAERTRIRTLILVNLRKSAEDYPLAIAFSDASSYEAAASLDAAIEVLTRDAAERSETANLNYAAEVGSYAGPPEAGVRDIRVRIRERLFALAGTVEGTATLRKVATDLGLAPATDATAAQLRVMLQIKLQQTLDVAGTRDLATRLGLQ